MDLEAEVIVLRIGDNIIPALQDIRRVALLGGITNKVVDVRLDCRKAGLGRVPSAHKPDPASQRQVEAMAGYASDFAMM
jgi:hypothetical protein